MFLRSTYDILTFDQLIKTLVSKINNIASVCVKSDILEDTSINMIYEWKQNEDQLKFIWVEDKQSSSSNGIYDVGYLDRSYHGQLFKNDQLIAQSLTINEHECMIALDIIPNIHAFMNNVQEYIRSRKKQEAAKKVESFMLEHSL